MSESFAALLEQSLVGKIMQPGEVITANVIHIDSESVVVDAGLKSESIIPASQFFNAEGELTVAVGDDVEVVLDKLEDGTGETVLSREKAKRAESWKRLLHANESQETVIGVITARVKGGFTVDMDEVRAFLPGSLVDTRPLRDTTHLENKPLEFKVIKVDQKRNNIVVSRRAVLEEESGVEREELLKTLAEGVELKGIVKNLTDYGAFIDLGGLDGLLHITDMSWKRIKHPSELLNIGDEIDVKVLRYDAEKQRVSLGIKQMGEDPWTDLARRFKVGSRIFGKVSTITDYGCFVEIENGIEGLVHMSEMDWTNKNINPNKVVTAGQEVEVMVLDIDEGKRRFSLGLKQCANNPWDVFAQNHQVGDKLTGQIKSITDFGVFIGLDGDIDGLVHLSDLSWDKSGEEAVHDYQKGQELETTILAIDVERERISLGVKQLTNDVFSDYLSQHPKGSVVTGAVSEVAEKEAFVDLADGISGVLRASDVSQERVNDVREMLKAGDTVEAKIVGVDRKANKISLSIRAKEQHDQQTALDQLNQSSAPNATFGDLLKDKI